MRSVALGPESQVAFWLIAFLDGEWVGVFGAHQVSSARDPPSPLSANSHVTRRLVKFVQCHA